MGGGAFVNDNGEDRSGKSIIVIEQCSVLRRVLRLSFTLLHQVLDAVLLAESLLVARVSLAPSISFSFSSLEQIGLCLSASAVVSLLSVLPSSSVVHSSSSQPCTAVIIFRAFYFIHFYAHL
jgi:hypothetical protein